MDTAMPQWPHRLSQQILRYIPQTQLRVLTDRTETVTCRCRGGRSSSSTHRVRSRHGRLSPHTAATIAWNAAVRQDRLVVAATTSVGVIKLIPYSSSSCCCPIAATATTTTIVVINIITVILAVVIQMIRAPLSRRVPVQRTHAVIVANIGIIVLETPARRIARRVRIEGDDTDPGTMALAPRDHPSLVHRPNSHQVVLSADDNVLSIGTPTDAQKPTEIGTRDSQQLHRLVAKDAQEPVLTGDGQIVAARREGELVDRSGVRAKGPLLQGITSHLGGLARVNGEAVAQLVRLVVRRGGHARQLFVVQVEVAGGVAGEEQIRRTGQPLQTGHFGFVDQALERRGS